MNKKKVSKIINEEIERVEAFERVDKDAWNKLLETDNEKIKDYTMILANFINGGVEQIINNIAPSKILSMLENTLYVIKLTANKYYNSAKIDINKIYETYKFYKGKTPEINERKHILDEVELISEEIEYNVNQYYNKMTITVAKNLNKIK